MIGPHYEKIAQVQNRFNTRQLLQRIQTKSSNPLSQIVDKLKREFSEYETAYDDGIIDHQINSVDRLLSFDGKLGPILSGLEKQNNLLRKQLAVMENQLSNTVGICEQILNENGELKQIIKNKNHDIEKIIETVALNESQARSNLQDKLDLLQQENSILIRHLDEVKREHQGYADRFVGERQEVNMWKKKWEESKKHMSELLSTEQQLSRKLSLAEHNLYNETEKVYQLQHLNQNLSFENAEMKVQIHAIQQEDKNFNMETLQKKMEEQYSAIIEEHQLLKRERTELLREAETRKLENEQLQDKYDSLEKKSNKWNTELEMANSLLGDQKHKNASLQTTINKLEQKIDDLRSENNKLRLQCDSTNNYAVEKEKLRQRQVEQLREELDRKSRQMESRLKEIKEKTQNLMEAKEGELRSLNDTNIELRKILQRRQYE